MTDKVLEFGREATPAEKACEKALRILQDAESHIYDADRACKVMREFLDNDDVTHSDNREAAVWLAEELERRARMCQQMHRDVWAAVSVVRRSAATDNNRLGGAS